MLNFPSTPEAFLAGLQIFRDEQLRRNLRVNAHRIATSVEPVWNAYVALAHGRQDGRRP